MALLVVSLCLSLAEPSAVSAVNWSQPRLAESTSETSICSTSLGQSICLIYTCYLLYAGCGFRSVPDLATLSQYYPLYGTAVNASLPKTCHIFCPDWYGGLAGFHRTLEGISNSGVFIGIPLRQSLWRYTEHDWLIGNFSVTYVTLVPWRRELWCNIPLPRLLYHGCTAGGTVSAPQWKTDVRLFTLSLYTRAAGWRERRETCMPTVIGLFS